MKKAIALAVIATAVLAAGATAGVSALSGSVTADGSSTVGPYAIAAAEGFQKKNSGARVTVGISGTGGGFERFCRNETVEGERGGMGYFGFSYYEENADKLKLVKVDQGKGRGCIAPSIKAVQGGTYRPLARPLFIYAKKPSFKRAEVAAFIGYIFNNERGIAKKAGFISLTDRQLKKARYQYKIALKQAFG